MRSSPSPSGPCSVMGALTSRLREWRQRGQWAPWRLRGRGPGEWLRGTRVALQTARRDQASGASGGSGNPLCDGALQQLRANLRYGQLLTRFRERLQGIPQPVLVAHGAGRGDGRDTYPVGRGTSGRASPRRTGVTRVRPRSPRGCRTWSRPARLYLAASSATGPLRAEPSVQQPAQHPASCQRGPSSWKNPRLLNVFLRALPSAGLGRRSPLGWPERSDPPLRRWLPRGGPRWRLLKLTVKLISQRSQRSESNSNNRSHRVEDSILPHKLKPYV